MQTDTFDVVPLTGAGPVHLGMSREQVHAALVSPLPASPLGKSPGDRIDCFFENAFQVSYDSADRVEYIELYRDGPFVALYRDVDVFATRAQEMVELISREAAFDPDEPEHGYSFIFPTLELSLWRRCTPEDLIPQDGEDTSDDDFGFEGLYFETIGVGRPGYYSDARRA